MQKENKGHFSFFDFLLACIAEIRHVNIDTYDYYYVLLLGIFKISAFKWFLNFSNCDFTHNREFTLNETEI